MIHTLFLLVYNIIRISINICLKGNRFNVNLIQRINPWCTLRTYNNGVINIRRNNEIEFGCDIQVHSKGGLYIGKNTYMNRYCMISCHESIKIGEGCMFGPGVKIFDNNHKYDNINGVNSELNTAPIEIGNHCWIASDVVILKGVKIGDNCIIGAGCIIVDDVPANTLVRQKNNLVFSPINK